MTFFEYLSRFYLYYIFCYPIRALFVENAFHNRLAKIENLALYDFECTLDNRHSLKHENKTAKDKEKEEEEGKCKKRGKEKIERKEDRQIKLNERRKNIALKKYNLKQNKNYYGGGGENMDREITK